MNDKPFTITFYSYRGGAERFLALVNVGVDLARRGRKVLLVDFDLESPGLTELAPLRLEQPHSGLVEFVAEYLDTNQAPPVSEYLYRAASIGKKGGELWVMPAGKEDPDYWAALARIDWQELYDLHGGFLFIEDTRLQWQQKVKPNYVLINAPGGVNDLSGICTRQLPDLVMLLAGADGMDLTGLRLLCAEIRGERKKDFPKNIEVALVLSRVPDSPDDAPGRVRERAAAIADALGLDPVDALVLHDDRLLADRHPVASARPRSRAAREYRRLARVCMTANCENDRDGAREFLKRLQKDLEVDRFRAVNAPVDRRGRRTRNRLDRILTRFIRDTEIVLMGAACLFLAQRRNKALYTLGLALDERPDAVEILLRRAEYYLKLKLTREAVQDLRRINDIEKRKGTLPPDRTALDHLSDLSPEDLDGDEIAYIDSLFEVVDSDEVIAPREPEIMDRDFREKSFLESHQWKEVIALLEPRVNHSPDFTAWDAYYLALAHWAATGQLRPDLCKRGVDRWLEQEAKKESNALWILQGKLPE